MQRKSEISPVVFFSDGFDWDLKGNRYYFPYYYSYKTKVLVIAPHSPFRKSLSRIINDRQFLTQVKKDLYILRPGGYLPLNRTLNLTQQISYRITRRILERTLAQLKIESPILWFFYPEVYKEMKKIRHSFSVYHIVDEYSEDVSVYETPKAKEIAKKVGEGVSKDADLILTSSIFLYEKQKKLNENTFYIGNGSETEFILEELKTPRVPVELNNVRKPIIGFIGNMESFRFDYSLMEYLLKSLREISFVLVGSAYKDRNKIERLSREFENCFYLDRKPYGQIPKFLKYFDVCIIPYKRNSYTKGVLPMKLFEYFAVGSPVVSTDLYSLAPFRKFIYMAENEKDFVLKIKKALLEKDGALRSERRRIALKHSWRNLIDQSIEIITKQNI